MVMECDVDGCQFATKELEPAVAVELLKLHDKNSHTQTRGGSTDEDSRDKVKFRQPRVDLGQSLEEWETFLARWAEYKRQMKVGTGKVSGQLISCASDELETSLRRLLGENFYDEAETVLLHEMKQLVVKFQNPAVYVEEFMTIKQEVGESVRNFLSRLKGVGNRCGFVVTCVCCKKENKTCCDAKVSYADDITKYKLVSGLVDSDIKEDALGLEATSLEEIVKVIEVKEGAKEANRTLGRRNGKVNEVANEAKACFGCGDTRHGLTTEDRRRRCPYYNKPCPRCKKTRHSEKMCRWKPKKFGKVKEVEVSPSGEGTLSSGGEVGLISPGAEPGAFKITATKRRRIKARLKAMVARVKQDFTKQKRHKIPHKIYEHLKWITKAPAAHARVLLEASMDVEGYKACGEDFPGAARRRNSDLRALPDTGCMATCMGLGQLSSLGIKPQDLLIPEMNLSAANSTGINIVGVTFLKLKGGKGAKERSTKQMVYVVKEMDQLLLSMEACKDLGIIGTDFPKVGSHGTNEVQKVSVEDGVCEEDCELPTPCKLDNDGTCSCPKRQLPPPPPEYKPGTPVHELKTIILNHYAVSVLFSFLDKFK